MQVYIYCLLSIPIYYSAVTLLGLPQKRGHLCFLIIVGIQLFLISALRGDTVGADLASYLPAFDTISNLIWDDVFLIGWEPGYIFFNKLLSLFPTENNLIFFIATSLFAVIGYLSFISKYSKKPWLSVFLFIALGYYLNSFNIIRQSMAMVIVLHSLIYIKKRCFWKYLLCIVCAMLFHKTAIICLLPYFFYNVRPSIGNFAIMLVGSYLLSFFAGPMLLSYVIDSSFSMYSLDGEASSGYGMLIFLLFTTLLCIQYSSKKEEYSLENQLLILACCLQFFALNFSLFSRIVVYFSVILIVLIPNLMTEIKSFKYKLFIESCIVAVAILYFYKIVLSSDLSGVVPYVIADF